MKNTEKRNLEYLQLLESLEVMLMNGNSINPNSVIRSAIQVAIGKDVNLNQNNIKQTTVEWLVEQMNNIKGSSISMNGRVQFIEKELNNLLEQAKAIDEKNLKDSFVAGAGMGEMFNNENRCYVSDAEKYLKETFKLE